MVAEMDGRAGAQKKTKNKKTWNRKETQRQSGRQPRFFKNRPFKKNAILAPLKTNGRADGNQKKAFPKCFRENDCLSWKLFRKEARVIL